jgi:hypothetical protein
MTEHEDELVETVVIPDPLRSAFAAAIGALMERLPPSRARDIAIEQVISAHTRTEEALARHRILN